MKCGKTIAILLIGALLLSASIVMAEKPKKGYALAPIGTKINPVTLNVRFTDTPVPLRHNVLARTSNSNRQKHRYLMLEIMSVSCGYCTEYFSKVADFAKSITDTTDFRWIGLDDQEDTDDFLDEDQSDIFNINSEEKTSSKRFSFGVLRNKKTSLGMIYDPQRALASQLYLNNRIPTPLFYVLNENNEVVYASVGALSPEQYDEIKELVSQ